MERRRFIRNIGTGSAALMTLSSFKAIDQHQKITILHTNDTHSHIDPFPANHKKYPNKGGVSRRAELIKLIRAEEENVLLLDAGDIWQGTPYFNMHGGEVEFKLMSAMGYDAATMGNHDFDGGIEQFEQMLPHAKFPFLCSNYNFDDTVLNGKTQDYKVFHKGALKIGVFGVGVELDGLVGSKLYRKTQYLNPVEEANRVVKILKGEHECNLVVCLSHLGYHARLNDMCDTVLAKETSGIDLIIGGHTHTFMPEPEMHKNKDGKSVLINQVGWAGLVLGRVDFIFDKKGNPELWASNAMSTNYSIA